MVYVVHAGGVSSMVCDFCVRVGLILYVGCIMNIVLYVSVHAMLYTVPNSGCCCLLWCVVCGECVMHMIDDV